jgi:colanic acid biosynthesis glycosyl transferase WcaI
MKILIISPCYAPDLGPSASMLAMLAENLVSLGNQVTVLAAVPHFPTGFVAREYRQRLWTWEYRSGVRVGRAWIPSGSRANLVHRALTFLVYQVLVTLAGLKLEYDVAFIANPAIETGLALICLGWLRRKPVVFGVWDVYPEVGVRMGLFRSQIIIQMVAFLEDVCLQTAQCVQVLGERFVADLAPHRIKYERITIIPPWLDTELIRPLPRQNSFSHEHKLDRKFVVLYAGNLGLTQGLEVVLAAARRLANEPEILFVFVGDGAGKEQLIRRAYGLDNVRFLPFQPRGRVPEMLASADLSLVVLKRGIGSSCLPSKIFSILSSARPVLACVDKNSEAWNLIERSRSGLCVLPENPEAIVQAILYLKKDPARGELMGRNGRLWAKKYHSSQAAAKQFEILLGRVVETGKQ